jgi:1-acyl-sn-glycerol-3-phosphate acyltransferase
MSEQAAASPWLYQTIRLAVKLYLRVAHRFESNGDANLPAEGGVIVASNHCSYLDPPIVACGTRRRMFHFMARATLWQGSRWAHWFFTHYNCIPVDPSGGDVSALRRALKVLKQGHALVLFPEGTRSPNGELGEGQGGIGFVIARARVPVVPAYISGAHEAFPRDRKWARPVKVKIEYGPCIPAHDVPTIYDHRPDYARIAQFVMEQIAHIRDAGR